MPDQILRDELLGSDRWLDLPNDSCRLAFFPLLLKADDFGNLEAGIRRIFRLWAPSTQIKTPEAAATVLGHLLDADLARHYPADGREFLHLPRFRSHRSYLVRKCPPSPWCDVDITLGKHVRKVINQGLAKNVTATSQQRNDHVLLGVGVEVGVGVGVDKKESAPEVVDNSGDKSTGQGYADFWKAKGKALFIETKPGESDKLYIARVRAHVKAQGR